MRQLGDGGAALGADASDDGGPPHPAAYSPGSQRSLQPPIVVESGQALMLSLKQISVTWLPASSGSVHESSARLTEHVLVDASITGKSRQIVSLPSFVLELLQAATSRTVVSNEHPTAELIIVFLRRHIRTRALPHEMPAPSAHMRTTSPGLILPPLTFSSMRMGIDALEVFPTRSMFERTRARS